VMRHKLGVLQVAMGVVEVHFLATRIARVWNQVIGDWTSCSLCPSGSQQRGGQCADPGTDGSEAMVAGGGEVAHQAQRLERVGVVRRDFGGSGAGEELAEKSHEA